MYTALDPTKDEIRLLRVLSGSSAGRVECELQSFSLQENDVPVYKALSYRWGDDQCEHDIILNDEAIGVRKNLHGFLLQMQSEKQDDWFFIDALCINQDDLEERTHQVKLMGKVYLSAEEVVAWLLREPYYITDDDQLVYCSQRDVPLADREGSLDQHESLDEDDPLDEDDFLNQDDSLDQDDLLDHDGSLNQDDSLDKLKDLVLHNSFWSRLWIVQEVLLAKRLTLRMGSAEMEWTNLLPEREPLSNRIRFPKGVLTKNQMLTIVSRS